ncbi:transposase, partial [Patescibacteria group bacterium]|nr:transposase [Patescibacteria group bacterium]
LLKQKTKDGISKLMKQLTNAYTLFFNQKNKRIGGLMQGRFKAAQITNDNLLIHILRYIHLNPVSSNLIPGINTYYPWSSYSDYSEQETNLACSKDEILSYFKSLEDFEKFHKDQEDYAKELEKIKHLAID